MAVKWWTWAVGLGLLAGCGGDDTGVPSQRMNAASSTASAQLGEQDPWRSHCEQMTKYASLPLDDGPHPGNATEWWYWNAHLFTDDGARYGMMFVFYQFTTGNSRAIATTLAITDVNDPDHPVFADLSFSSPKYYHTTPSRFELELANDAKTMRADGDNTHAHVSGQNNDYEVDLDVTAKKAAVMHGDHGLVEFFEGSNIYYSTTRMDAKGTLKVHGESHDVTGIAWFDHEYGAQPITNWLWMSIQLDNDEDLMVWRAVSLDGTGVKGGVTYVRPGLRSDQLRPERLHAQGDGRAVDQPRQHAHLRSRLALRAARSKPSARHRAAPARGRDPRWRQHPVLGSRRRHQGHEERPRHQGLRLFRGRALRALTVVVSGREDLAWIEQVLRIEHLFDLTLHGDQLI